VKWRDRLRNEIRLGTFIETSPPPSPDARLTVADVIKEYRSRYVNVPSRRPRAKALFDVHLDVLLDAQVPAAHGGTLALGEKAIGDVLKADIEAVRDGRRALLKTRSLVKGGECGINRLLSRARHLFAWAAAEGYATETPFKRHGITVIKLSPQAEGPRTRRFQPGDARATGTPGRAGRRRAPPEARLSASARVDRRGPVNGLPARRAPFAELGSSQRRRARHHAGARPRVGSNEDEQGPGDTGRAATRAELVMRRDGPDGQPLPLSARVFGNEVAGEPVASIRESWERTCAAAGISGLHFHDLRRGVRLSAAGVVGRPS
jgi:hypothetical protein